jgi:hypothetical protein
MALGVGKAGSVMGVSSFVFRHRPGRWGRAGVPVWRCERRPISHAPCQAEGVASAAQVFESKGEIEVIPAHGSECRMRGRVAGSEIRTTS